MPAPLVLGLTVAFAAVVHSAFALGSPSMWIVPDELIYSELAKSIGGGGLPAIRDEATLAYGIGYPLLLAPVWAVFGDVTTAYPVAKVLNALILSLTAVPAYLLARRFVTEVPALIAAALAIVVPSMLYAGTLMTEVALYPAFVLAMLAVTRAVERPTVGAQCGALGAIALATSIKTLAAVLVGAYVASALLYHWLDTRDASSWRARLRAYRATWLALGGAGALACVGALATGRSLVDLLGAYAVVLENVDLIAVPWWFLLHVAELDLYVAVIPFAATLWVVWRGLQRGASHQDRLFAAAVLPVTCLWLGAVAAFASTPLPGGADSPENVARLHERGMFFLAALFFIGLVLAPARSIDARRIVIVTGLVAASLPALIPVHLFHENAYFQAMALFPWVENRDTLAWPFGVLAVTAALATLHIVRARLGLVLAAMMMLFLITSLSVVGKMQWASTWTKSKGLGPTPRWVDDAVGDRSVSVLWAEPELPSLVEQHPRHRVIWLGEFFNRSLGTVYELGAPMPYGLPATPVRIEDGRVVLEDGRPADLGALVLVPCHVLVQGVPVARDLWTGATVVRIQLPLRASVSDWRECGPQLES